MGVTMWIVLTVVWIVAAAWILALMKVSARSDQAAQMFGRFGDVRGSDIPEPAEQMFADRGVSDG